MTWRKLRRNHGVSTPRYLVFLDCESRQLKLDEQQSTFVQPFRLGVAISIRYEKGKVLSREVLHFDSTDLFWVWLESKLASKTTLWLVAHNLPYDLKVCRFFQRVENGIYRFDLPAFDDSDRKEQDNKRPKREGLIVLEDPPTILTLKHKNGGTLIGVDTLNYWRCSLSSMGASVGLEKGKFPGFDGPDDELAAYCENDATILEKCFVRLLQWWQAGDYGNFRFTAPSLAMAAFRHSFMQGEPIDWHDVTSVKSMEVDSYTGGETEVYRYGSVAEKIYQVDVTSLYPHVMKEQYFPAKLVDWFGVGRPSEPPQEYPRKAMIGEVELDTCESFPYRHFDTTLHVTGRFVTTLAGPELFRAEQSGNIVRWHNWSFYRLLPLFRDFVDHFWKLRLEYQEQGEIMLETFVKLMLNSLYGKFGQMTPPWKLDDSIPAHHRWGKWHATAEDSSLNQTFLSLNNRVFRQVERRPSDKSSHAIASFVTAAAREHMLRLRNIAGRGHYFYQATDSLCLDKIGYGRLCDAGEVVDKTLGKLKLELESPHGMFFGNNWYTLDKKIVIGGKKKTAEELENSEWEELHFQGLRQMLDTIETDGVIVKKIIKHRRQDFRRGTVQADGEVRPFVWPGEAPQRIIKDDNSPNCPQRLEKLRSPIVNKIVNV